MNNILTFAYETLNKIYKEGAYLSQALPSFSSFLNGKDRATLTRLVYGVVEKHEEFSVMLARLCKKSPRPNIRTILRIGMYLIKYSDSYPDYAAVNECVELTKTVKKEQAGFVNATLKNYIKEKDFLPQDKFERLSFTSNYPVWLIMQYFSDYGEQEALRLIGKKHKNTHIRLNQRITDKDFQSILTEKGKPTSHGYLVSSTEPFAPFILQGKGTVMALDSLLICDVLCKDKATDDILDVCAGPGGKSVYLAEKNPEITVYAEDVHEHRVELINKYARRMQVENIKTKVWDGTQINKEYLDRFSYVLVDAPCSGVGVVASNPDILINRSAASINELNDLQFTLLSNASLYVKKGGTLVYSTCSNLKSENQEIVKKFLQTHDNYKPYPSQLMDDRHYKTFTNDDKGNDGFFVARFIKE